MPYLIQLFIVEFSIPNQWWWLMLLSLYDFYFRPYSHVGQLTLDKNLNRNVTQMRYASKTI